MRNRTRLLAASITLAAAQIVHVAVPADTSSEGVVGLVVGLALLIGSIAAAVGAARRSSWAPVVALVSGAGVAVGFVAYHAVPVHSPVTNPYAGEPVSTAAWLSVAVAVAAGAWTAVEGWRARAGAAAAPA